MGMPHQRGELQNFFGTASAWKRSSPQVQIGDQLGRASTLA